MAETRGSQALCAWLNGTSGHKQADLAEALKVHQTTVSSWKRGTCPSFSMTLKIAKVTGIKTEWWRMQPIAKKKGKVAA